MPAPAALLKSLESHGQHHLLAWWDHLTPDRQQALARQIEALDLALVNRLAREHAQHASAGADLKSRAERAQPPTQLIRQPRTPADQAVWAEAKAAGEKLLAAGRVGAVVVAGGQGSRLGFDKPKGMFPIGPLSERTLFQVFCEQLVALGRKYGKPIPYFVMTSDATHDETVAFFESKNFFGLPRGDVFFFQQGSLPAVHESTGKILLSDKAEVSTSPDGHGGILKALKRSGLLDVMAQRGIDVLYYHQVDNPTAAMCDSAFLGFHRLRGSQMTTKVVAKESAAEKMGVVVSVDGQTQIIEYSDLPPERSAALAEDGSLLLWAGNTAVHAFDRKFLAEIASRENALPFHLAHKPVPHLDEQGNKVEPRPDQKNAYKFEQFIFDVLPLTAVALVVEGDRAREFNPVKNQSGKDSPETSRAALNRNAIAWLTDADVQVAPGVQVEISPLFALDAEALSKQIRPGLLIEKDTILAPSGNAEIAAR